MMYRPDPSAARNLKDYLKGVLGDRADVALTLPTDWDTGDRPAIVVFDDGGGITWPVASRTTLRVVVWAKNRTDARELASLAMGYTLTHKIPGLSQVRPVLGLLDARDSNTGGIMVSYTVRAYVRVILESEP